MLFVISQAEDVNKKNGEADALGNHVSTKDRLSQKQLCHIPCGGGVGGCLNLSSDRACHLAQKIGTHDSVNSGGF